MKSETQINISKALSDLGFSIVIHSSRPDVQDNWPNILYRVELFYAKDDGEPRHVLDTDYRIGVGHVDVKSFRTPSVNFLQFTVDEQRLIETWQSKPYANFSDKALWASAAHKLAKKQKVEPILSEVLYSLIQDGQAHIQSQSFEDWCSEYGYDSDSRKAEAIYRLCDDIGRSLSAKVPATVLETATQLLSDY